MKILGLDPGLRHTGWGIIYSKGSRLSLVACGCISPDPKLEMAQRLAILHQELSRIIGEHQPEAAAIEETFVNKNAASALKLGAARGVVMMTPALHGLTVAEYSANHIKKSVVGAGHAAKEQIMHMVGCLLPGAIIESADAADALAVAICHSHYLSVNTYYQTKVAQS